MFSQVTTQFYIPISSVWEFQLLKKKKKKPDHSLRSVVLWVVLVCISLMSNDVEHLFIYFLLLLLPFIHLFWNVQSYAYFLLNFWCSLCILKTSPLLCMWYGNIFSKCISYIFILLIMSFTKQRFWFWWRLIYHFLKNGSLFWWCI